MIDAARIASWRAKYKRGESGYGDDILDLCDEVEASWRTIDLVHRRTTRGYVPLVVMRKDRNV